MAPAAASCIDSPHMAVPIEGDLGGSVAVTLAHNLRMHPREQGDGGRRVAQIVQGDLR